jgi:hypothetical protein
MEDPADHDSVGGVGNGSAASKSVIQTYSDNRKLVTYWGILSPHFDIAMTLQCTASGNGASARFFEGLQESSIKKIRSRV